MSTDTPDASSVRLVGVYCAASDRLCAEGVPPSCSALVVERCTCPSKQAECCNKPKVVIVGQADEKLGEWLERHGSCVEARFDRLLSGPSLGATLEKSGLYMALSTSSGYSLEPAHLFTNALAAKLGLSREKKDDVETALDEAVVNAFVHGNLGLESSARRSLDALEAYGEGVEERLGDPSFGGRRIEVTAVWDDRRLTVTVADEGGGYDASLPQEPPDPHNPFGRGLTIIRALAEDVTVEDGGRRLCMIFPR